MTASQHLSGEQFSDIGDLLKPSWAQEEPEPENKPPFFHGTTRKLAVGDRVMSHKEMVERGMTTEEGLQNTNRAWATSKARDAYRWASDNRHGRGFSRVYEVEPVGEVNQHGSLGVSSREGFRVTREVPFEEIFGK
jgi:hypothetical protein